MESESKLSEMDTPRSSSLSSLSDSDSDSDTEVGKDVGRRSNDSDSQTNNEQKIEWLATTRKRRSTAGNRMKSMLANEEPDSDLELLFAEDENDQGFSDVDENASDVHMDSSDDEDDNDNNQDDLEGEKELERQAKERRIAQRKRKAQEAIPAKFRKKVRIDPTSKTPAAPLKPAPRPKKKSERTSWLPSPADLPTRASSRQTTRLSKEQLHQQMVEREARRLKQLAQMQKKAARLEAMKKPPMTQEERLREAAIVEKRNSKSLNRWEEAEKQREEERRAKLAALHQRTLKGPVITFWSGIGEWMGRHMVIEEPAKEKKKRGEKAKVKEKDKAKGQENVSAADENKSDKEDKQNGTAATDDTTSEAKAPEQQQPATPTTTESAATAKGLKEVVSTAPAKVDDGSTRPANTSPTIQGREPPIPKTEEFQSTAMPPPPPPAPRGLATPAPSSLSTSISTSPLARPTSGLAAPAPAPAPTPTDTKQPAVTPSPGLVRPVESKPSSVLAAPILAPPLGISVNGGGAPPMLAYGSPKSNVLAPPNTSQGAIPPAAPNVVPQAAPSTSSTTYTPSKLAQGTMPPSADPAPTPTNPPPMSNPTIIPPKLPGTDPSAQASEAQAPQPSTGARNAIVFQNFDDNALKDRSVRTQILFGRKMNKLAKPSPAPLCVITNHPARYRDPRTGLPYFNAYAYREIQRLSRGEYRWSRILGAWVGSGTYAARGVPERFLHPDKERPEKVEAAASEEVKGGDDAKAAKQTTEIETPKASASTQVSADTMAGVPQEPKQPTVSQPDNNTTSKPVQSNPDAPPAQPSAPESKVPALATAPSPTPASQPPTQLLANPPATTEAVTTPLK
ncbi:hypothetical protein FDECE_15828 [Fusarium decemcellulare]|nr:hypothetical protein FDECE_15828 [Fusarium decemcellulare]